MCWKVHKRGRKGADYMSRSSPLAEGPSGRATDTQVSVTDSKSIKLVQFDQQRSETDMFLWAERSLWRGLGMSVGRPLHAPLKTPDSIMWKYCLQFPNWETSWLQPAVLTSRSGGHHSFCLVSCHHSLEMPPLLFFKKKKKKKRYFCSFPTKAIISASYINMGFILISVLDECFHTSYKNH